MNEAAIIQHRGIKEGKGQPNSLEGVLHNYKGHLEADAVLLKDGTIAILHERDAGLTLSEVEMSEASTLEQKRTKVGSEETSPQAIPHLREFINLAMDAAITISLELKGSSIEQQTRLVEQLVRELLDGSKRIDDEYYNQVKTFFRNNIRFESFSVSVLQKIRTLCEDRDCKVRDGLFWPSSEEWARKVPTFEQAELDRIEDRAHLSWAEQAIVVAKNNGCSAVEFLRPEQLINPEVMRTAHERGLKVGASLILGEEKRNEQKWIASFQQMGVDYIKTES